MADQPTTAKSSKAAPGGRPRDPAGNSASAPRASAPRRISGPRAAAAAARQLTELTGRPAEGVVGLEPDEDGWRVEVEVVEVHRIPETTDVMAVYEVEVDTGGDVREFRRIRRYVRGAVED
jgi:Gas vesicle synthesis protein GvpO